MVSPGGSEIAFRFVDGPANPRVQQIPSVTWEQHRPEIIDVYISMGKIDHVAAYMRKKYGLDAKKGQYRYRLDKWLGKNPKSPSHPGNVIPPSPQLLAPPPPLRRRKLVSSIDLTPRAESSSDERPRKRRQTEFADLSPHRSAHIVDGEIVGGAPHGTWDSGNTAATVWESDFNGVSRVGSSGTIGYDSPRTLVGEPSPRFSSSGQRSGSIGSRSFQCLDSPRTLVNEPGSHLNSTGGLSQTAKLPNECVEMVASNNREQDLDKRSGFNWSPLIAYMSIGRMPHTVEGAGGEPGVRVIRHGQLVDTLTTRDTWDIGLAADLLSAIGCSKDAFELYTTLLKRYHLGPSFCDAGFWYYVVQCTYAAVTPEHLEIARHIIEREQQRFQDTNVHSDHPCGLVLQRLSAVISGKASATEGVSGDNMHDRTRTRTRTTKAKPENNSPPLKKMLDHLPQEDRSLDLLLYHAALQHRDSAAAQPTSPVSLDFTPYTYPTSTSLCPFESDILRQRPGPFELDCNDGRFANPCLRTCVHWCAEKLDTLAELPSTPGADDRCPNMMAIGWAEATSLFFVLWKHLIKESPGYSSDDWSRFIVASSPRSSLNGIDAQLWIGETQRRMGISPTLLLMLVCRVIHDGYDNGPAGSNRGELLPRLRQNAEKLLEHTDRNLGRRFLRQYILHHTPTTHDQPWRHQIQDLERSRALVCFRNALGVSFSGFEVPTDTHEACVQDGVSGVDVQPGDASETGAPLGVERFSGGPTGTGECDLFLRIPFSDRWSGSSCENFRETGRRAGNGYKSLVTGRLSGPSTPSRYWRGRGSLASSQRASGMSALDDLSPLQEVLGLDQDSAQRAQQG
ncbi:hypothetical protein OQA88_5164 [Cercophora sp. LCS_1]